MWFAHYLGTVHKLNGRSVAIPLYHRRPPEPFRPRLTQTEQRELDDWIKRVAAIR